MVIISALVAISGLGLYSLKVESLVEAIGLLTSLHILPILSAVLISDSLELLQLEVGTEVPVLESDYSKFSRYITKY